MFTLKLVIICEYGTKEKLRSMISSLSRLFFFFFTVFFVSFLLRFVVQYSTVSTVLSTVRTRLIAGFLVVIDKNNVYSVWGRTA